MNRYEKIRKIGEGAFGKAYLMKEKASGNQVVVKETCLSKLPPKERDDARRETAVLAQLKHPSIVTYYDSFEEFGNLYIVMDYCDGGDLAVKINAQHGRLFSEDEILDWITQLCLAVKHIHDRNILHRDIKCQNIFLTKSGQIKLGDFGIAKILDSTVQLSHTLIGTPYYFSPEICMGRPYNHKSDIWSLGCVFYELATLKHAFDGGNLRAVMQKIQNGTPPPISRTYSPDLTLFISSILRKNPRDRPAVHTLLQRPIVTKRINKFLSDEQYASEFSHTILHGERLLKQLPRGAGRGANARRPQSAQVPGARPNLVAAPAVNQPTPAQRPSTAADGNRQNAAPLVRNRIDEDPAAAVRALRNSSDSDNNQYQLPFNPPARVPRQEPPAAPRPAAQNEQRVPIYRPMPFPAGSRGADRGDYRSYLEFLRQLDVRRHQAPVPDPSAILAPQPMAQQPRPQAARPASAAQNGRINVLNGAMAKQLLQNQNQNHPVPQKRSPSANAAPNGGAEIKRAFVRPMARNNPPPSAANNNNRRPISRDQMVMDRLQRIRQANLRSRNALAKFQQANRPAAQPARPPSAAGNRQPVVRQASGDRVRQVQQTPLQQQQQLQIEKMLQHNPMAAGDLTDALRIVQVPGIPPSPRVPSSVAGAAVPRLTDALKAVTPRQPEPNAVPAPNNNNGNALPIDQEQLKKLRQAELQKANANPPIIINDRPYWLPNQSISEDLNSLTPEMTASKMVSTVESKSQSAQQQQQQPQPQSARRRRQWSDKPKDETPPATKVEEENFVVAKSAVAKQQQRPSWSSKNNVSMMKNSKIDSSNLLSTKDSSSVVLKLATGQFDVSDFKLLRTCSLPSLAGDLSPASTVSTLDLQTPRQPQTPTPSSGSRFLDLTTVSSLNRTIGLSNSTPDLLLVVSPTAAVGATNFDIDVDETETLKLIQQVKESIDNELEQEAAAQKKKQNSVKVAWTKLEPQKEESVKGFKREFKKASSNNGAKVEPKPKKPEDVRISVATTVDDEKLDVDNVSKSMMNILAASPLPQENSSMLSIIVADSVEVDKPTKSHSPKIVPNKAEPMRTIIEQLTVQTGSIASSVSSLDGVGLDLLGSGSDMSRIFEKLEKLHGTDSPNPHGDEAGSGSRSTLNALDALEDHNLDTMTAITLASNK